MLLKGLRFFEILDQVPLMFWSESICFEKDWIYPEVELVIVLDADKEGFLRSETSLIQTAGRASRHQDGKVIFYADQMTGSLQSGLHVSIGERSRLSLMKNTASHPKAFSDPFKKACFEKRRKRIH